MTFFSHSRAKRILPLVALAPLVVLAGCGGGGGGGLTAISTPTPSPTTIPGNSLFAATTVAPTLPPARGTILLTQDDGTAQFFDPKANSVVGTVAGSLGYGVNNVSFDGRAFLFSKSASPDQNGVPQVSGFYQVPPGSNVGVLASVYAHPGGYPMYQNRPRDIANNGYTLCDSGGGLYASSENYSVRNGGATVLTIPDVIAFTQNGPNAVISPDGSRVYANTGQDIMAYSTNGSNQKLFSSIGVTSMNLNASGRYLSLITQTSSSGLSVNRFLYSLVLLDTQSGAYSRFDETALGVPNTDALVQQVLSPDATQVVYQTKATDGTTAFYEYSFASKTRTKLSFPAQPNASLVKWLA